MSDVNPVLVALLGGAAVGGGLWYMDRERKRRAAERIPQDQQDKLRQALVSSGKVGCMALGAVYKIPPDASAGICEGLSNVAYVVGKGAVKYGGRAIVGGAKGAAKGLGRGAKALGSGVSGAGKALGKGAKSIAHAFHLGGLDDELEAYELAGLGPRRRVRHGRAAAASLERALRRPRLRAVGLSGQARASVARMSRGLGELSGCGSSCGCGPCRGRWAKNGPAAYGAILGL